MHDLWQKIVEETKTQNPLELCSWQRWEITQANHNFECDYKSSFTLIFMKEGYHIRKYKRYIYDHSVSVPKSTKLDLNKRSATRSKTAISIPQSVVSTELKAVMPTEESVSHKGETFVQETEVTYQTLSPMRRTFVFLGSRCTQPLTPRNARALRYEFSKWRTGQKGK